MYFLYWIDNHQDTFNYLDKFNVFNKERIAKHLAKHEKLLLVKPKNAEQEKEIKKYFEFASAYAQRTPLTKRPSHAPQWTVEMFDTLLGRFKIPFKIFKHEAEVKDFANDKKSTKTKSKNATITPKKAPTIKKSSVKSVKITKKEGKTMAKRKTRKRKLSGNALKQTAYARIKSGSMKLVKKRGKNINTRYEKPVRKGVYIYRLKPRKK